MLINKLIIPQVMYDIVILLLTCLILYCIGNEMKKRNRKLKLPPGPPTYPIIGRSFEILKIKSDQDLINTVIGYIINNGYIVFTSFLFVGEVCGLAQPAHVEAVLTSKTSLEKPKIIYSMLDFVWGSILTLPVDKWHNRRKLFSPAFNQRLLNRYFGEIVKRTNDLCKVIDDKYVEKGIVNVYPFISYHMLCCVMDSMMGIDSSKVPKAVVEEGIHGVDKLVGNFTGKIRSYYSGIFKKILFSYEESPDMVKLNALAEYILKVYDAQEKLLPNEDSDNLYQPWVLLENIKKLPPEDGLIELRAFIVGGYETGSVTISYLLVLLAMHPEIQEQVYQEMKDIFGDSDRLATEDDVKKMFYLDCCFKESLRLYPTAPVILRKLSEDVDIGEYTIPSGAIVLIFLHLLHRNPSVWKNPDVFNPDNFSPENCKNRSSYAYLPFSAGPRNCIGYRLANIMLKITTSALIRKYKFETDMKIEELKISRAFTLQADHIRVGFRRRKN